VIKFTNNSLDGINERSISKVAEGTWEILVEDFKKAVSNDFFHTDITRSNIWDILYESAAGKLQLEISGRHVWWLFYKRVPSEIGLHDSKRFQLEKFPIACCIPHGQYEITKGQWELWLPQETKIEASVTFSDGFIHSFESERGFMAAADTFVFKSCTLYVDESIGGTDTSWKYKLRRKCGQAFNSMHYRASLANSVPPLFLFFDHQPQTELPVTITLSAQPIPESWTTESIVKSSPTSLPTLSSRIQPDSRRGLGEVQDSEAAGHCRP
jgi:hypothetical protein